MDSDERIEEFYAWATNLGCPSKALPSEEALKSLFKSGQSQLFVQMQSCIRPRQYVDEVRENLLIAQMIKHKGKVVPVSGRSFMPRQLQIYLKMQDLQKEKETAELRLAETKKEFDSLAASIKARNIQTISTMHKKELQQSKCHILQLKLESLTKNYEQELQDRAQILATMPVKFNPKNASEKMATKAVEQALKELEQFYNICDSEDSNVQQITEAKTRLWSQMREIFASTPNPLLFNAIMKIKDEQLQYIMDLNKNPSSHNMNTISNTTLSESAMDNFDVQLLKTKGEVLALISKCVSAQDEVTQLEEHFAATYGTFMDELQKKVNSVNGAEEADDDDSSEEIISNFILQYNLRNFNQALNDHISEQISQLRSELDAGTLQLENHELLLGSIKQMYGEINTSINRIQHDMQQLSQIKEKILYSKNILKNMLDGMHAATHQQSAKSQLFSSKMKGNMSLTSMESFNIANTSVFSSTKLELDASNLDATFRGSFDNNATLTPGNSSTSNLMPSPASGSLVPSHLLELNTFVEMPLVKFSCMPHDCAFLLSANPFIVDSQELASTVQLTPGHLLTPDGALQEVRKRILWASAIAAHTSDMELNSEARLQENFPHLARWRTSVDPHALKLAERQQHEEIVQLLDSIESLGKQTEHQVQRINRIYNFILENPLRNYVPPDKCYKNANFSVYAAEFNLYYRMAKADVAKPESSRDSKGS